ncbi:ABC transporter ATP-binding protein [Butyrivibrio sp. AE2015]|uniref:ABC transporter ATP-binding protein n=1 Tax=Butyrivibrio sp. AE2015 TaxID=1280663 RepID=UPI0003B335EA|nr:polysaccharide ABC transporter ATP-binding protein [Butyrivibrio sp. AE2015]
MSDTAIKIENLKKQYTLGAIGGKTLSADLNMWWAKVRGKENPYAKIGEDTSNYGQKFYALNGINLEIKKGEAVGIIGTNGAGKSTLLKLLSRVTAPTEGRIRINGRITSMLEVGTGFHPELTGRENIYMNGAILGMTKAEIDSKMEDIIEFSECRQFIDTPVKRYSSGMYVKLAFSVAAHLDSDIMIMDEVLAVGDMKFQQKCLGKMDDAAHGEGKTILYVSHNMTTIRQLCSRCIVLSHGTVIFDGDVESAIEVYMGENKVSNAETEIAKVKRAPEFSDHKVTMTKLTVDNDQGQYMVGDVIKGKLFVDSPETIDDVHLRIIVKHADGTPITMSTSSSTVSFNKGENDIDFVLDTSMLAPGRYNLGFVVYNVNEYGTDQTLDGVHSVYVFQVSGGDGFNNNMEWKNKYWGYVLGKELEVK